MLVIRSPGRTSWIVAVLIRQHLHARVRMAAVGGEIEQRNVAKLPADNPMPVGGHRIWHTTAGSLDHVRRFDADIIERVAEGEQDALVMRWPRGSIRRSSRQDDGCQFASPGQ